MLRFRLQEMLAEHQFQTGKRVTLSSLAEATHINRTTLSKMINQRGYSTVTDNLDRLCQFFGCSIDRLVEYVPEAKPATTSKPSATREREQKPASFGGVV